MLALAMAVAPAPADPPGYRFFKSGGKQHKPGAYWNPCRSVRYGIDFTYALRQGMHKPRELKRWKSAIAEVGQAMGMRFTYAGTVRSRALRVRPRAVPGVDIVITFGSESRKGRYGYGRALHGPVAGVAGVAWRPSRVRSRSQVYSGYVVIDAKEILRKTGPGGPPFDARPADQRPPDLARALYLHEFGHAVGLNHVKDRAQVMFPKLDPARPDALGSGDRRGLRILGRQPCF